MISVSLRDFELPARPIARPSAADGERLDPRHVADLIRLLIVIHRVSFDDSGWEEVNRIFLSLCDSFSGDAVRALRVVRDSVRADGSSSSEGMAGKAFDRLAIRDGSGDVVEALRQIVAPAITGALQQRAERLRCAAAEARLDLCFEHCMQGMMTFAPDGTCLFLNRAAARLLRLPVEARAELVDRRLLDQRIRKVVDDFMVDPARRPGSPAFLALDIGCERLQCFPLVATAPASETLLHLFIVAEANSGDLTARLQRRARLSKRETSVVRALIDGKSHADIAADMNLSIHTVRTYVDRVYGKLEVSSRHELMKLVTSMTDCPTYPGTT